MEESNIQYISREDFLKLDNEIDNEVDYKELFNSDGIQMFVKVSGEGSNHPSGIARYKYFGTINFDIDTVFAVYRDDSMRHVWDKREIGRRILKRFPVKQGEPKNSIIWTAKRGQFLVANRDFVSIQSTMREIGPSGETVAYRTLSRAQDNFYEPVEKCVRANLIILGIKLWTDSLTGKTKYVCVTQIDPSGWISSSIVNWVVKFVPSEFEKGIIEGCKYRIENNMDNEIWMNESTLW